MPGGWRGAGRRVLEGGQVGGDDAQEVVRFADGPLRRVLRASHLKKEEARESSEKGTRGVLVRVAVLADIHGNLPALEAVLHDIDALAVDAIVLNGDLATGPMPVETLDRLAELGEKAIWVRGNADRELVAAYDGALNPDLPEPARAPTEYCASRLGSRHRDLLSDLPLSVAMDVTRLGPVRFCHATTRSDTEIVLVDSPIERYRDAFADTDEPTVVLGHTHMPFDRLADRRRFLNPGSVGMPYGSRGALWALIGPDVALCRTDYEADLAAEMFRTAAPEYPGLPEFIEENVLTVPSDAEALAVFSRWGQA
jgi:putative phosphoesterase